MDLVIIRIGEYIPEKVSEIVRFLHGIFYDIEEVKDYIDFEENEKLRKEIEKMSLNGEYLVEFGMHKAEKEYRKELAESRKELKVNREALKEKDKEIEELKRQLLAQQK